MEGLGGMLLTAKAVYRVCQGRFDGLEAYGDNRYRQCRYGGKRKYTRADADAVTIS